MVRKLSLLVLMVLALNLIISSQSMASSNKCSLDNISFFKCKDPKITGKNDGDKVTIIGKKDDKKPTKPKTKTDPKPTPGPKPKPKPIPVKITKIDGKCYIFTGISTIYAEVDCNNPSKVKKPKTKEDPKDDPPSQITLKDIASFKPNIPVALMEPNGWAVIGVPTNFYAEVATHTKSGRIFQQPAEVRFTPRKFNWNYGDGKAKEHTIAGKSWKALKQSELTKTGTSHNYKEFGNYDITLTVSYSAEYRFGNQSWQRISGYIKVPANELQIRVGTLETLLVAETCLVAPKSAGC